MPVDEEPWNEVPVTLPWRIMLERSAERAVFLDRFRSYREALVFTLNVRWRESRKPASTTPHVLDAGPDVALLVAGEVFAARRPVGRPEPPDAGPPWLVRRGGRGNEWMSEQHLLLSPVPRVNGRLRVTWADRGLATVEADLPTGELHEGAPGIVELWPAPGAATSS